MITNKVMNKINSNKITINNKTIIDNVKNNKINYRIKIKM